MKILIVLACLVSSFAFADASDPYNTLIWNRANDLAGNGYVDRDPWYEWWYYKVVDPDSGRAFFLTYGVINPWDEGKTLGGTKAVVEVGDFVAKIRTGETYPVTQFSASHKETLVKIGENTATDKRVTGHVVNKGHDISWDFSLERKWSFDAMGWSKSTGASGIYWYPAQASAAATGWMIFDGHRYEFKNAPAYQDRNWGDSFPKWWAWLVSNHFEGSPDTVLSVGGGQPKVLGTYLFQGLCIGLRHQGEEYIFRTTDLDKVVFNINWGTWEVVAENSSNERIEISAYAPPEKFMMLPFESPQGATFYDYEALLGHMTVKLFTRSSIFGEWKPVAQLETNAAGIEWGTPNPVDLMTLFGSKTILQTPLITQ